MTCPLCYAWVNVYKHSQAQQHTSAFRDLYGRGITDECDLRNLLETVPERPEVLLFWNFCERREALLTVCNEYGIDTAWWEDGFFPHYDTIHCDPIGFAWESSIPRLQFHRCTDRQRRRAYAAREGWIASKPSELLPSLKSPFVLWPLQVLGDMANLWDLALTGWGPVLRHFRECLPRHIQLVIKDHPYAGPRDTQGLDIVINALPNTVRLPRKADLNSLLRYCNAVAGVNSSVLYEARLMHLKPVYTYGKGWFTNHHELFTPIRLIDKTLPNVQALDEPVIVRTEYLDDYADWFLAQLMGRQLESRIATADPQQLRALIRRLTYASFLKSGEAIFDNGLQ